MDNVQKIDHCIKESCSAKSEKVLNLQFWNLVICVKFMLCIFPIPESFVIYNVHAVSLVLIFFMLRNFVFIKSRCQKSYSKLKL
jgi:hypothetical protein